jgi:methyl-accepting chemotaxis protein
MASKSLQALLFVCAGVIALLFVKLMFDMSSSMSEMTGYVGAISQDVSEMQNSMDTMNESMLRMEKSIHGLGQTFSQGSKQLQQMNPAGMMQQVLPDRDQRTR